ncbi:MAG: hypothetical protein ACKO96_37600 [Flammeovirgaceae bacterium]
MEAQNNSLAESQRELPALPAPQQTKQFKHYFFEGLMIFLAISLGFFADNLRETIGERKQASQLAASLFKEVYKDSIELTNVLKNRQRKMDELRFFINFVRDSSLTNPSERFLKSFAWSFVATVSIHFDPSDGVLQQIHNSNNLQLFSNAALQNQINDLYVNTSRLRNRWNHELDFQRDRIVAFNLKYLDLRWYRSITNDYTLGFLSVMASENIKSSGVKRQLRNVKIFDRDEAESLAQMYLIYLNGTRNGYLNKYMITSNLLLKTLRQEYPMETTTISD